MTIDDGAGPAPLPPRAEVVRRPRPGVGRVVDALDATTRATLDATSRATSRAASELSRRPRPSVVRAAPEIARFSAQSAWQVFSWSLGATVAGANYVAQRALQGDSATSIMHDAAGDLREAAWRALGVPPEQVAPRPKPGHDGVRASSPEDLQQRGDDLLRRSNDVHVVEDTHPAFARILGEITPDEARMLRFLFLDGPQPSLDVRTFRPFGIGSVLVAKGLNMIGEHAGCRNLERVTPYLTNLARLGLIDFSKEQVSNPQRYQVIEAQPKVTAALKRAGRMPRTIHRSIALTEFGQEFVRTCLPLNGRAPANRQLTPGDGRPRP